MGGGVGYTSGGLVSYEQKQTPPEELLAKMLKDDLGVEVNPQALRMFVRWRWDRVQTAAHRIHDAI